MKVLQGRPRTVVPQVANEDGSDLVIIGTHAKRGPLDVAIGTNAESLLSSLDVEVLLVRPTRADVERTKAMMIPDYPWVFTYV